MSHTPRCKLVDYLEELNEEEFEKFKMHLEDYPVEKGYKPICRSKTEKASHIEIARYMIEAFDDIKAVKMTVSILDRINKKDLAARIRKEMPEYFLPKPSTMTKKEKKEREKKILSNLHDKFFGIPKKVEVILDPKTAYPALILSEDRKRVHMGDQTQILVDNPERFCFLPGVLGAEGIESGTLEWVVEVGKAKEWAIGVARESVERKNSEDITITQGFWVLQLAQGEYQASTSPPIKLTLWKSPQSVLIILEHDFDRLIFYNADSMEHIFTFNYPFSEKLFPFLLVRDKEIPLKISPRTSV
ncbi:erythroid membrane-associated protein-like isoform X2 [Thamnophis elegans]|uniref:erythroid membrane-associated protein-like isoform X2 n=1 Tax=Thamnophis elegans TaxID=35005 RepID=UPI001376E96E|nr:erythroid membrane-associated protein-like isoform X2 [Thamnophis elegans]